MSLPTPVTDSDFDQEVLEADTVVLVDFWAEWCGPCKMVAPVLDDLSQEYDGKIKFTKVDVDENPPDRHEVRHPEHPHPAGLQGRQPRGPGGWRRAQGGNQEATGLRALTPLYLNSVIPAKAGIYRLRGGGPCFRRDDGYSEVS